MIGFLDLLYKSGKGKAEKLSFFVYDYPNEVINMERRYLDSLRKSLLFRNMTDDDILSLIRSVDSNLKSFSKNDIIMRDRDLQKQMGIIITGKVHTAHVDANGNSNLMDILYPGDVVGVLSAVGRYPLHITATAQENGTDILFLTVESLLRDNVLTAPVQIRFLQNLTMVITQKGQRLTIKLEDSIRHSTREKLQDYLSGQYHKTKSRTFSIPLNRQDLADYLFVDRSALSNELCRMRDEGLIKFDKSNFELLVEMPISEQEEDPNT